MKEKNTIKLKANIFFPQNFEQNKFYIYSIEIVKYLNYLIITNRDIINFTFTTFFT